MTDWFSREGARKGHDLARRQAEREREQPDAVDPIVVAGGGVACEYCGQVFDRNAAATTSLPSATLFRCPECERWTEAE
jgi:hypothetical protein